VGNVGFVALTLSNQASMLAAQGRLDEAEAGFLEALQLFSKLDQPMRVATMVGNLGDVHRQQGRMQEAEARLVEAIGRLRALSQTRIIAAFLGILGEVYAKTGRLDEARVSLDEADALIESVGDPFFAIRLLCNRGEAERGYDRARAWSAVAAAEARLEALTVTAPPALRREVAGLREALLEQDGD
jgi:tetratricopeptide (TPR) repeat protein